MKIDNKFLDSFIKHARSIYEQEDSILLHRPIFLGNEKKYLNECIDSNYVSSVGKKVQEFENIVARFTGSKYAIATVNGTAALHIALKLADVNSGDEVITQALTFVATCNAITYANASPVFIDVDRDTMGLSPESLENFLKNNAIKLNDSVINKNSGKKISACIPMHTFGMPCRIREIMTICDKWGITLIEDAAESLGSYMENKHTGTFGKMGTISFNGNKIITSGGGGMILTDDEMLAKKAKHITTTSKVPHPYEFIHDEVGYNYRMPNLNAALGFAQFEKIDDFLHAKKKLAKCWENFFKKFDLTFFNPIKGASSNFWLNTILLNSKSEKEMFIEYTNQNNVMTRPVWRLMSSLDMFKNCETDGLENSKKLSDIAVNIPSSVPVDYLLGKESV